MHPSVARAIQEIDAAVCNGDTFEDPDDRAELLSYIVKWTKELPVAVHENPVDVAVFNEDTYDD